MRRWMHHLRTAEAQRSPAALHAAAAQLAAHVRAQPEPVLALLQLLHGSGCGREGQRALLAAAGIDRQQVLAFVQARLRDGGSLGPGRQRPAMRAARARSAPAPASVSACPLLRMRANLLLLVAASALGLDVPGTACWLCVQGSPEERPLQHIPTGMAHPSAAAYLPAWLDRPLPVLCIPLPGPSGPPLGQAPAGAGSCTPLLPPTPHQPPQQVAATPAAPVPQAAARPLLPRAALVHRGGSGSSPRTPSKQGRRLERGRSSPLREALRRALPPEQRHLLSSALASPPGSRPQQPGSPQAPCPWQPLSARGSSQRAPQQPQGLEFSWLLQNAQHASGALESPPFHLAGQEVRLCCVTCSAAVTLRCAKLCCAVLRRAWTGAAARPAASGLSAEHTNHCLRPLRLPLPCSGSWWCTRRG